MKPLAIDLFCGAGGMSEGILQAGFHIIYSNDINIDAATTYQNRHKQLGLIQGKNTWLDVDDIRNVTWDNILSKLNNLTCFKNKDIKINAIFGGPPCQGFSRAGRQQEEDTRNMLFKEYLRLISEVRPDYVVFENVPGILDIKFREFLSIFDNQNYCNKSAIDIIIRELSKINYNVLEYKILNAADYGVPQNRNRLILIAYKKGCKEPTYPKGNNGIVTVSDAVHDIEYGEITSSYQKESIEGRTKNINTNMPIPCTRLYNNERTNHKIYVRERFELFKEGETIDRLRKRIKTEGILLRDKCHLVQFLSEKLKKNNDKIIDMFKNKNFSEHELNVLLTKKISRMKLSRNEPSCTILTLPDDIISPFNNRIFTVRELARIQSFDDSFVFYGKRTTGTASRKMEVPQYTQVGNAVPPLLAKAVASSIFNCIKQKQPY
ncbi:DNA cytosine methyltransferase [Clostridium botulinum]|nr:DNA cytosine methyltransferase [Clostridium botulinum]